MNIAGNSRRTFKKLSKNNVIYPVLKEAEDSGYNSTFDLDISILDESTVYDVMGHSFSWQRFMNLPRHPSHDGVNNILDRVEALIISLHQEREDLSEPNCKENVIETVYANSYVDFGKVRRCSSFVMVFQRKSLIAMPNRLIRLDLITTILS
jgi:hypothetical protein